jgi:hypothetical protein
VAPHATEPSAWLLGRLRELGDHERRLSEEALALRNEIAQLVADALPSHARSADVEAVVNASGYSRTLIDALRSRRHPWSSPT